LLFVAGGNTGSAALGTLEAYNPKTGKWKLLKTMPQAVTLGAGVAVGGKLYCIGGASAPFRGAPVYANVQIYQP
jgi:N-acetylneuraminic acid mutarotase